MLEDIPQAPFCWMADVVSATARADSKDGHSPRYPKPLRSSRSPERGVLGCDTPLNVSPRTQEFPGQRIHLQSTSTRNSAQASTDERSGTAADSFSSTAVKTAWYPKENS